MSSQALGTPSAATSRVAKPRSRAPLSWRRVRKRAWSVGFYLLVAIAIFVALFPFYWILRTSLSTNTDIARGTEATGLFPSHLSTGAYSQDFSQQHFLTPLLNSAIVALVATAITVVVATMAGYALARLPIRGSGPILAFLLFRDLGFLDSIYPLILAYLVYTLPIATWLLRNFFAQIPRELEEAALVDGATRLQALRKVVVPVALPGVFTAAILAFILAWNDFAFAVSFLETPGNFTAPLAIVNLGQSQFQVFYNRIDAAVVIITIPIAVLVLFAQRRIVAGLTAGSFR
jgi:trehalose/maltose transport system permease protein